MCFVYCYFNYCGKLLVSLFSQETGLSVLENSISLVIFFIQSEESQALKLGVLVFLYFLSFFNPLFICSSLKKDKFLQLI